MNTLNAANSIPGDLVKTLMGGQQTMVDQAMKQVSATMETKVALQQQATTMNAVASMTGIGSQLNTYA